MIQLLTLQIQYSSRSSYLLDTFYRNVIFIIFEIKFNDNVFFSFQLTFIMHSKYILRIANANPKIDCI